MPPTSAGQRRRAGILDAALRCFTEHGYAATTIEQIRRRSGASTGSIYHFFPGQEQLAAALYVDGLRSYQESVLATLEAADGPEAAVRAVVHHHLDWVAAHPALARFLLDLRQAEAVAGTAAEVRAMRRDFFRRALAALQPHVDAGAIRPLPGPLLVALIIGPVQEAARWWLHHRGQPAAEAALARTVLADAAWLAVRVPPDAAPQPPRHRATAKRPRRPAR